MAWKDVGEVWRKARGKWNWMDNWGFSHEILVEWILSYPPEARRAAAMALTVVKWSKEHFEEDIRNVEALCGACAGQHSEKLCLWSCSNCPAGTRNGDCACGPRKKYFDHLLKAYIVEWNKLPDEWKEVDVFDEMQNGWVGKLEKILNAESFGVN